MLLMCGFQCPQSMALDDEFYYALGGGEPISRSATNRPVTIVVGRDVRLNVDLMCGDFDMSLSVEEQLKGIKGAFSDLMSGVINAATGAVAALPGLVLQKLNPALYDLLQNGILQGSEEFHIAQRSCEDMVGAMGDVMDDYGWGKVAKSSFWSRESQAGSELLETKQKADTEGANAGVIWVDGAMRGGAGQPPIALVGDTAMAGYNILINRNAGDAAVATPICAGAAICEEWESPAELGEWVVAVLGEEKIRTCKNCEKTRTQAGKGLSAQVASEQEAIVNAIDLLVVSPNAPTADELDSVSGGPGMLVSRRVIEAIREEKPEEQATLISRLAAEMALSRTMERAMIARRALLAGMKEPNIVSTGIAPQRMKEFVQELEKEIDNLLFEIDVRRRIATNTTSQLLMRDNLRRSVPISEKVPVTHFNDGAVHN